MHGFLVGAVAAGMSNRDAVAVAQSEVSLSPYLHNEVLKCGVALFMFVHTVTIWCVVVAEIEARVIETALGFKLLQERLDCIILCRRICDKLF